MQLHSAALLLTRLCSSVVVINRNAPVLPDPHLSPGDVLTTDTTLICKSGYTHAPRLSDLD